LIVGNALAGGDAPAGKPAFTPSGVHDVRIESLQIRRNGADGGDVTGSQDVTVDHMTVTAPGAIEPEPPYNDVTVDGTSSDVTISRNELTAAGGYGVQVKSGAEHITVSTNDVNAPTLGGIALDGVQDAAVTSNTVYTSCGPVLSLEGGSSA